MPAITTAASPIASIQPPVSRAAGDSVSGREVGDRPFAAVLKEKTASSSKSKGDNNTASASDSRRTTEATESADENSVAAQWVLNGVQIPSQPASNADLADMSNEQAQKEASENALLALAGIPANSTSPSTRNAADSSVGGYGTKSIDGLPVTSPSTAETSEGMANADAFEQAVSDIRSAMSRATPGAASPSSDANSPARNAASLAAIALEGSASRTDREAIASADDHVDVLLENSGTMLAASTHATVTAGATNRSPEFRIGTPIGSNHWESAVGNSLVMMSGGQHSRAELVLTPPQLGRIEVSLSMRGDDASLTFVSSNPVVREALENALPRLREILADAGISLGQTQVGSESPGQTAKDSQNRDNSSGNAIADFPVGDTLQQDSAGRENTTLRRVTLALVDTYA